MLPRDHASKRCHAISDVGAEGGSGKVAAARRELEGSQKQLKVGLGKGTAGGSGGAGAKGAKEAPGPASSEAGPQEGHHHAQRVQ